MWPVEGDTCIGICTLEFWDLEATTYAGHPQVEKPGLDTKKGRSGVSI